MKTREQPLRVLILGLRGFPNVQGGVETHVENLAPLIAAQGCQVTAIVRSRYMPRPRPREWCGVRYVHIWCPKSKSLEATVHTFLGVIYASVTRPDVLHIHAVGPAVMVPLARALGLKVVVTHHGPDYLRQKWGTLARLVLRLGEHVGVRFSNSCISISCSIQNLIREKYCKESCLIPNGVPIPRFVSAGETLKAFGLTPRKFVLHVGRLVPEKRHLDLIRAFRKANLEDWKLAIVGASDHPDEYTKEVLAETQETSGVVAIGFQTGNALRELYTNAGIFVLPSSHEGLPIALLEALSYGLPSIASQIPANLEVGLPTECYVPVGDIEALSARIQSLADTGHHEGEAADRRKRVAELYNWVDKASRTVDLYNQVAASAWSAKRPDSSTV